MALCPRWCVQVIFAYVSERKSVLYYWKIIFLAMTVWELSVFRDSFLVI